jgi:hypothetical protein
MAKTSLGVGALSYAGQFNVMAVADQDVCPDLDVFAATARDELRALAASTRATVDRQAAKNSPGTRSGTWQGAGFCLAGGWRPPVTRCSGRNAIRWYLGDLRPVRRRRQSTLGLTSLWWASAASPNAD